MKTIRTRTLMLIFGMLLCWLVPSRMLAYTVQVDGIYYALEFDVAKVFSNPNHYSGQLTIPESIPFRHRIFNVTSIDYNAFTGCTELTSVGIPNSVTSIDGQPFSGCTDLTSIYVDANNTKYDSRENCNAIIEKSSNKLIAGCKNTIIPNSVTSIGISAFSGCTGLTSIEIPNSVTSIGISAFSGCTGLTSIEIPNSVTSIGSSAFTGCSGLTSIIVNHDNTIFDSRDNCNAIINTSTNSLILGCKNTVIPNSVTSIGWYAFKGCTGLTSIEIPNSVTSIGWDAFSGCTGLTSIEIPNSVTSIEGSAFYGCTGLTSVEIPNSVTSIGSHAFRYCTGLTSVVIPNSVTTIGNEAFEDCTGLTSVFIPNSVTSIGYLAFYGCTGLASVVIPSSVTSISGDVFQGCTGLASIHVDPNNTTYDSRENCSAIIEKSTNTLLIGCKNTVIPNSVTSIEGGAFYGCTGLTSVEIPNSVTSIGSNAFYGCTGLTSITIPNSVTSIGWGAFSGCTGLASIEIPNSVTSIDGAAFYGCTGLASVVIPSSVTSINGNVFDGCTGLASIHVDPNNTTYDSRENCSAIIEKSTNTLLIGCKNTVIPNSVTSIEGGAFSGCTGLTSIEIPNSVTSIGWGAFSGCTGLTSIEIPNSVTSIEGGAFYGCTGLTSVEIPNSVTSIGEYAFLGCTGLTSVTIPNSVTSIGECAFALEGLTSIIANGAVPPDIHYDYDWDFGLATYSGFSGVDKTNCILYVPVGCKSAYEKAGGWSEFQNIVEFEPDTDISSLDNAIYVEETEARIGGTMDIPVMLKNSYPVRGFQFKLELPEGATINSWALSSGRMPSGATESDKIATQKIDGNTIAIACSLNYGDATFTGNDGEIATVNVTFAEDMEEGRYPIYLTGCDVTTADGVDEDLSDIKATLVLEDYLPGDANGDGKVRIGDATAILNYIVGNVSNNFQVKAADTNGDGRIRIGDATAVLNLIVNQL